MRQRGISLFEIVIVVGIFAIVAVLVTRSTFLTLRGSKKSDSQIKVKENLEYSLSVIERQIRNADLISSTCEGSATSRIDYVDESGGAGFFSCETIGQTDGYIASGAARLTTDEISLTNCSFTCVPAQGGTPTEVTVDVTGREVNAAAVESSTVTTSTKILLRNY